MTNPDPVTIDREHLAQVVAIARRAARTDDEATTIAEARRLTRTGGTSWTPVTAADPMDAR